MLSLALACRHQPEMIQMLLARGAADRYADGPANGKVAGSYFASSCLGALNLYDRSGTSRYKFNLDVLAEADPSVLHSRMAVFSQAMSCMGMGMCGPGTELLEHFLERYPEVRRALSIAAPPHPVVSMS